MSPCTRYSLGCNLVRGKWKKFSLDMLLTLAAKVGMHFRLELKRAA